MSNEMEIYKNMLTGEIEIKDICIYVERDSVCMGEDITAPHGKKIFLKKIDKLSDLLKELMSNYLVKMNNCVWEICEDNKTLGYIKIDSNGNKTYELAILDDFIINLKIKSIYCKNKGEKKEL